MPTGLWKAVRRDQGRSRPRLAGTNLITADVLAPRLPYPRPYAPNTGQPTVQVMIGLGYPIIPVRDTWLAA
jgi:hypothetical protein